MAQINLTLDDEILKGLFLGRSQDAVEKLLEKVIDAVLRLEAEEQVGAGSYERSSDRKTYRNGYRERTLTTRVGSLTIQIPKLREGTLTTELFVRYQRSEQALTTTLMEMVVQGVSTLRIETGQTAAFCSTPLGGRTNP